MFYDKNSLWLHWRNHLQIEHQHLLLLWLAGSQQGAVWETSHLVYFLSNVDTNWRTVVLDIAPTTYWQSK